MKALIKYNISPLTPELTFKDTARREKSSMKTLLKRKLSSKLLFNEMDNKSFFNFSQNINHSEFDDWSISTPFPVVGMTTPNLR